MVELDAGREEAKQNGAWASDELCGMISWQKPLRRELTQSRTLLRCQLQRRKLRKSKGTVNHKEVPAPCHLDLVAANTHA